MNAVIVQGSVFLGRSKNFSGKLKANYQCHVVHFDFAENWEIKLNENETLNNFSNLLKNQPPQLLIQYDDTNNNGSIKFFPAVKINFKEHECECLEQSETCDGYDYYFFPYCSDCFLNIICDNLVSIDFSNFRMKATKEIMESTVIFEYCFNHECTSDLIIDDYIARNIPVSLINDLSIPVTDEINDRKDLVYDYSDHLCVLHFIQKREKAEEVNCSVLCNWEEGKYNLQLLTTKNIASNEEILIQQLNTTKIKKYCFRYLI
jgi:hypothetical protein